MGIASVRKGDAEQQHIAALLTTVGAKVYVLGTRQSRGRRCQTCGTFVLGEHGTRQTPGVADLIVFLPVPPHSARLAEGRRETRLLLFIESKVASGRLTPDQRAFRDFCQLASIPHITGDLDAVIAWLLERQYLKTHQVPHYRLPPAAATERTNG